VININKISQSISHSLSRSDQSFLKFGSCSISFSYSFMSMGHEESTAHVEIKASQDSINVIHATWYVITIMFFLSIIKII
jgi:hypothetical protein